MRKRSGQVHSRESSATLQLTVSLLYHFAIIMVQIITKYDIMKKKQIRIDGGIYYDRL